MMIKKNKSSIQQSLLNDHYTYKDLRINSVISHLSVLEFYSSKVCQRINACKSKWNEGCGYVVTIEHTFNYRYQVKHVEDNGQFGKKPQGIYKATRATIFHFKNALSLSKFGKSDLSILPLSRNRFLPSVFTQFLQTPNFQKIMVRLWILLHNCNQCDIGLSFHNLDSLKLSLACLGFGIRV